MGDKRLTYWFFRGLISAVVLCSGFVAVWTYALAMFIALSGWHWGAVVGTVFAHLVIVLTLAVYIDRLRSQRELPEREPPSVPLRH